MSAAIQLHPDIVSLTGECEKLRSWLCNLIEQQISLEEHVGPYLEAIYLERLGQLEFSLLQAQVENARLRRKLELSRIVTNRGEPLDKLQQQNIETRLDQEWQEWRINLNTEERRIKHAASRLAAPTLCPEATQKLKTIYRKLVRLIHPDMTVDETPAYHQYWQEIQHAYRNGDLDYLEILSEMVHGEADAAFTPDISPIEQARHEKQRLTRLLESQIRRLNRISNSPPLSHENQLRDTDWITKKQSELSAAIRQEVELHIKLQQALKDLTTYSSTENVSLH